MVIEPVGPDVRRNDRPASLVPRRRQEYAVFLDRVDELVPEPVEYTDVRLPCVASLAFDKPDPVTCQVRVGVDDPLTLVCGIVNATLSVELRPFDEPSALALAFPLRQQALHAPHHLDADQDRQHSVRPHLAARRRPRARWQRLQR